jgi:hydrogen cyanide synthase HcnA
MSDFYIQLTSPALAQGASGLPNCNTHKKGIPDMDDLNRQYDIQPLIKADMSILINGQAVNAAKGETVLSVLNAVGVRQLSPNDHGEMNGAYCGMGVCYCCLVKIDGRHKRRACQTLVQPGMSVETGTNRVTAQEAVL